jgi:hypothetical protein
VFCCYSFLPGATLANVRADVVSIVTGQTDVSALSAACNKAGSFITSGEPAGWSVHDAAAGASATAVSAPCVDGSFKYAVLDFGTANYLQLKCFEAWDAASHAGTNQTYTPSATDYAQPMNLTSGGTLYIAASNRHLILFAVNLPSTLAGANGASMILERERGVDPWDTTANGYPLAIFCTSTLLVSPVPTSGGGFLSPRLRGLTSDRKGSSYGFTPFTSVGRAVSTGSISPTDMGMDAGMMPKHLVLPIYGCAAYGIQTVNFAGRIQGEIYATTNTGANLMEMVYDGKTFILLNISSGRLAIPGF